METENHSDSTVFEQKNPINLNSSMEETIKNVCRQKMEIFSEANRKIKSNQVISNFKNSNLNDSRIYGRKHCSNDPSLKDQNTAKSPLKASRYSNRIVSIHYDETDNEKRPWREIQSRNYDKKHRQRSCSRSTENSDQSLFSSSPEPDSNSPKRHRRSRSDSTDSDPKNQRNRHRSGSSQRTRSSDSNPKNPSGSDQAFDKLQSLLMSRRNRHRSGSSEISLSSDSDPKNHRNRHRSGSSQITLSSDSDPKNQRNRHRSGSSQTSLSSDSGPKNPSDSNLKNSDSELMNSDTNPKNPSDIDLKEQRNCHGSGSSQESRQESPRKSLQKSPQRSPKGSSQIITSVNDNSQLFPCTSCKNEYISERALKQHIESHDERNIQRLQRSPRKSPQKSPQKSSKKSPQRSPQESYQKSPQRSPQKIASKLFQCTTCKNEYISERALKQHINFAHEGCPQKSPQKRVTQRRSRSRSSQRSRDRSPRSRDRSCSSQGRHHDGTQYVESKLKNKVKDHLHYRYSLDHQKCHMFLKSFMS